MLGGYKKLLLGLIAVLIIYRSLKYNPLPIRNHVTLGFKRKKKVFLQTLDYLVYSSECNHLVELKSVNLKDDISMNDAYERRDFYEIDHQVFNHFWGDYGYIYLSNFMGETRENLYEFKEILSREMVKTNGLVIDVRNNPGGSINFALRFIQYF